MTLTPNDPIVQTDKGTVRGLWRSGSAAFLGIPFAQPPIGELRFAAPVPMDPWEGIRDAVTYGATPQRRDADEVTLIPEPSVPGDSTLNVNVFTPAPGDTAAALPVLVWIHGGGFFAGSPASPWYDGRAFNRDGIVSVTISYRLGFDGFGYLPDAPHNRGVRDWIAALEWVQANVAAFGGDPGRVTLAGQSAGGGAVLTLLGMPAAQGLFHSAWALSGAIGSGSMDKAKALTSKIAAAAGVAETREGFASIPEDRLIELQTSATAVDTSDTGAMIASLLDGGLAWAPLVDGDLVPRPTLESLAAGVGADKPLVLSAAADEATAATDSLASKLRFVPTRLVMRKIIPDAGARRAYLAANRAQRKKGTAAVIGRYITDAMFGALLVRAADARVAAGGAASTWVSRFEWPSPTIGWACHCIDVPFWFDCLDSPVGIPHLLGDHPPQALADGIHSSAARFIAAGDPGWTPWSAAPGTTEIFDAGSVGTHLSATGYASVRPLA